MEELNIKSPSKINIGLNVVSKRDDGYHNLQTIFYPLNLYDEIKIKKSDRFKFNSNDKNLETDNNNLIIRAHKLVEQTIGTKLACEIILNKNIPIGAGLGGGSSNAASVIKGLNELFNLNLNQTEMKELGLLLGSDVPLFFEKLPAYAESRGEILIPVTIEFKGYLLVINPGIHISTKWAFSKITPRKPSMSLKDLIYDSKINFDNLMRYSSNDFEEIVFKEFPAISEIKARLTQFGANLALMTGTGSTVFGFFDDEESAFQAELFFKCQNYFTYLQNIN